jgi:hypothetical protein
MSALPEVQLGPHGRRRWRVHLVAAAIAELRREPRPAERAVEGGGVLGAVGDDRHRRMTLLVGWLRIALRPSIMSPGATASAPAAACRIAVRQQLDRQIVVHSPSRRCRGDRASVPRGKRCDRRPPDAPPFQPGRIRTTPVVVGLPRPRPAGGMPRGHCSRLPRRSRSPRRRPRIESRSIPASLGRPRTLPAVMNSGCTRWSAVRSVSRTRSRRARCGGGGGDAAGSSRFRF